MLLGEFAKEALEDVERFRADWVANHEAAPDEWPLSMEPGEWFDQFLTSVTTGKETGCDDR